MLEKWKGSIRFPGLVLFVFGFLYLYRVVGDVLQITGDEGIYLQGGRLVALGQQPYRDFFTISGPLTFWIEGILAHLSAANLPAMRIPPILDAAFLAYAVYSLMSRFAGVLYSAGCAVVFLAYEVRPSQLNVNHRWDSAALALAAVLLADRAYRTRSALTWAMCGFLVVSASFATFSVILVAIPLVFWSGHRDRREALSFLGGCATATALFTSYLQAVGALVPMIRSMQWTGAHYTQANRVFYGGLFMGSLPGAQGEGVGATIGFLIYLLPAICPLAALLGWLAYYRKRENRGDLAGIAPLLAVAAALVLTTWPRWTSDALLHTMALSWFLCALLFHRLTSASQRRMFCAAMLLLALTSIARKSLAAWEYEPRETRVGNVRAPLEQSEFLSRLENWIQPGDSVFSFPYFPGAYYYLGAHNPTSYAFLQPGMMTVEDERRTIRELQAHPPKWVIYEDYTPEIVLIMWPNSDRTHLTLSEVTDYIFSHYHKVDNVSGKAGNVTVMERNALSSASKDDHPGLYTGEVRLAIEGVRRDLAR